MYQSCIVGKYKFKNYKVSFVMTKEKTKPLKCTGVFEDGFIVTALVSVGISALPPKLNEFTFTTLAAKSNPERREWDGKEEGFYFEFEGEDVSLNVVRSTGTVKIPIRSYSKYDLKMSLTANALGSTYIEIAAQNEEAYHTIIKDITSVDADLLKYIKVIEDYQQSLDTPQQV